MTVKYNVRASIIDIRRHKPQAIDRILVDSNVWYWYAYPNANQTFQPPQPYQFKEYPRYIAKAVMAKTSLFYCGLSLSEVGNLIESVERYIFDPTGGIRNKEYRHNLPAERQKVLKQL